MINIPHITGFCPSKSPTFTKICKNALHYENSMINYKWEHKRTIYDYNNKKDINYIHRSGSGYMRNVSNGV